MTYTVWQQFVQNDAGDVLGSATIEVRDESTGALATIYSGPSGGALSNPFTAGVDGLGKFYAAAGSYKITATSGTDVATYRHVPIGTAQYADTGTDDGQLPFAQDVIFRINTTSSLTYTLQSSDARTHIRFNNGSSAVSVVLNPSIFSVRDEIRFTALGSGVVSLVPDSTVTVNAIGLDVSAQFGAATLVCVAADEFDFFGDVV
jgi:hypothetical protein